MSDEETHIIQTEDGQTLTAEYKDGQLQIVEVSAYDKANESHILPDTSEREPMKYLQVLDTSKGLMHLDLLNFTIVKSEDGDNTFQVLGATSADDGEATLTCVLAEDNEDGDNQDSYVMVNTEEGEEPLVYLQSSLAQINNRHNQRQSRTDAKTDIKSLTPAEILEKAKALQKAKALFQSEYTNKNSNRGRKRKSDLPPPMELLSSPNFKLYLYSCKLCSFKCNAVKEMSKHKAVEHGGGKQRSAARGGGALQCARCPYRANVHSQLMKHVEDVHLADKQDDSNSGDQTFDCGDMSDADVLVCGACGFESSDRNEFRLHIEKEHGVNVMLEASVLTIEESTESN